MLHTAPAFWITFGLVAIGSSLLGLIISYTNGKALGMQTLPDISVKDLMLTMFAYMYLFLAILLIPITIGPPNLHIAYVVTVCLYLALFSMLIQAGIHMTLVYCCISFGQIFWEIDEVVVRLTTRFVNVSLVGLVAYIDLYINGLAKGALYMILTGQDLDTQRPIRGKAIYILVAIDVALFVYFQVKIELNHRSNTDSPGIFCCLRGTNQTLPIGGTNAQQNPSNAEYSLSCLRMSTGAIVLGFSLMILIIYAWITYPDDFPGAIFINVLSIFMLNVMLPLLWILRTPKLYAHGKSIFGKCFPMMA